jgi:hypothetical protein
MGIFAGYAYLVNSKRPVDDPQKKHYYSSGAIVLPFFWPLLLVGWIIVIVLRAIYFGLFLILFTLAMVFIRKPFWLVWLEKIALKIGGMLLDANSALIDFTFGRSPSV